jgi:hypothetical protein
MLLKSFKGTKQTAQRLHVHISTWMENNGYPAVNSEKTIFMQLEGSYLILHVLFVDDMAHVSSCDRLREEFMKKYAADFTAASWKRSWEWRCSRASFQLRLDHYIQETLAEYKRYAKKTRYARHASRYLQA